MGDFDFLLFIGVLNGTEAIGEMCRSLERDFLHTFFFFTYEIPW